MRMLAIPLHSRRACSLVREKRYTLVKLCTSLLRSHSTTTASSSSSSSTTTTSKVLLADLQRQLPPHVDVSFNAYDRERHGRGESYHPTRMPDAVVTPRTVSDVQTIVRFCVEHDIPLIPFGAGTSVEGHVCALRGGISLDMTQFQSIELPDIDSSSSSNDADADADTAVPDLYATVGAGVTRKQLNQALRHSGLHFTVDPGADATLGGMVATNASGTTTVKYGGMRENVLAIECIVADPEASIVNCGTKALKNSAGYDLLSLFCGSEGTLGVITSLTVKLHPIPDYVVAATCQFDSLYRAAQVVAHLRLTSGGLLSRCELLDETSVKAFNAYNNIHDDDDSKSLKMEAKPTLFLEFQGPFDSLVHDLVESTSTICHELGGSKFAFAVAEEERNALWSARHTLYYASIAYRTGATGAIVTDCCVPMSHFAELIDATAKNVQELGVVGPCFGHAGDGNLHCILPLRPDDSQEYLDKLKTIQSNLIQRTLEAGGTCTGEHGIGYGKIPYLTRQYGPEAVHVMETIKKALDPKNIMNPGKVVNLPIPY